MGGMMAQLLALDHPERVERLVLLNSHFGGPEVRSPTVRAGQIVRPARYRGNGNLAERFRENFAILTAPGFAEAHPELVLQSRLDEVSLPDNGELLAARIPGARLEYIEGSGHFAMWDQPAVLVERIGAFLG
jgi:pimeloyl-ACP methyl ester carboxylesterase